MPPQQAVEMIDDGVEGALLVIGRPPPLHPGVRLGGHVIFQDLHQTRFAQFIAVCRRSMVMSMGTKRH